jgi:hypothetical protein
MAESKGGDSATSKHIKLEGLKPLRGTPQAAKPLPDNITRDVAAISR